MILIGFFQRAINRWPKSRQEAIESALATTAIMTVWLELAAIFTLDGGGYRTCWGGGLLRGWRQCDEGVAGQNMWALGPVRVVRGVADNPKAAGVVGP